MTYLTQNKREHFTPIFRDRHPWFCEQVVDVLIENVKWMELEVIRQNLETATFRVERNLCQKLLHACPTPDHLKLMVETIANKEIDG